MGDVKEGELLWRPRPEFAEKSNIAKYMRWLHEKRGLDFNSYQDLWNWSVREIADFWTSVWEYFDVASASPYQQVVDRHVMSGAKWFEGSKVNYAEHVLRHEADASPTQVALYYLSEKVPLSSLTWRDLGERTRIVATQLRRLGIKPGDRVVSYMPNSPETAIAMLATTAIGGIWASASPEFGASAVIDRFAQLEPKLLFATNGYEFRAKTYSRASEVTEIFKGLPTLENVVWLDRIQSDESSKMPQNGIRWEALVDHPPVSREEFEYEYVDSQHPLWILFSSGTTGRPKAIAHSHVGALVEHLKVMHFHLNLGPDSVMFFHTTAGWVMWNLVIAALVTGSAGVLYDGDPMHPGPERLWKIAEEAGVTSFGASPMFVKIMERAGMVPKQMFDLSRLESILLGGAPSTPESFAWFYRNVKKDLWVTSQSGGTEIASGFVGASPTLPVYAGEIQCRLLGMDIHSWGDDGRELIDDVGELVVTSPFPSMPVFFWGDADGRQYHESYFDVFPGVWRHGDFIKINNRGGCYIYGRSDSTLNRYGVRIGTAEIYRALEQFPEVSDSMIVCCESSEGDAVMPLFVKMKANTELDDKLKRAICEHLRTGCSPRHVPDVIYAVPDIPYTLTGKKMEVPVRKMLVGTEPERAASRDAMMNPRALDAFIELADDELLQRVRRRSA